MGFEVLLWSLLAVGAVLPPLLALARVRLPLAVLAGALSPLLLLLVFLLSLRGGWGDVRYPGSQDSRTVALAISIILSAGTWAAGTAIAVLFAMARDWHRHRAGRG